VLEIPFQVSEKYISSTGERSKTGKNVAATGTYHKFKYELLPFKVGNFSTLHPDRLMFSMAEVPGNVAYHLHEFDSNSSGFLNFISNVSKFSQKPYFSLDLVELYSSCTYSFVGSEGTGVFGIGVIEAMACGSIPILSARHKDTSPFVSSDVDVIWYENFDDLMIVIESLRGNYEPSSQKNKEFAKNYSGSILLKNLVNSLC
jgi:glycosyltransferase involved in cell wall biosynthesis